MGDSEQFVKNLVGDVRQLLRAPANLVKALTRLAGARSS